MQPAPSLLSFLLILLYHSGWSHGLCHLENSTVARCQELEDVKYIETYDLESLKVTVKESNLVSGLFNNLSSLKHLDLSGGDLREIEPGCFRTLTNLKSLNLGENRIEYLDLDSLEGLTHLRSLNLRRNAIRQLPPALARLKNLKHLDIHGNPLECNCATLKVRDLITQRGVTIPKMIVCAGPGNMKGTSLMKSSATIICNFEQQDREMQNDRPEGSGGEPGSEDLLDELNEEDEEDEYVEEIHDDGESKESEAETPLPAVSIDSTTESSTIESTASSKGSTVTSEDSTGTGTSSLERVSEDEEIFFDNEERKEQLSTTEMSQREEKFTDALFNPDDGEEGSGEGSGALLMHYDHKQTEEDESDEPTDLASGLWDFLFSSFSGTTARTKELNLEEEQFIKTSDTNANVELSNRRVYLEESINSARFPTEPITTMTTTTTTMMAMIGNAVEVLKSIDATDEAKSGNVKAEVDELAEISPAKQSKKGMGSYVVLATLLAVLAALIGFAAYKGDFCRKKRKRNDVETGTELRDMQKSLLSDAGNATQPKITSNGNAENVPLVDGAPDGENAKVDKVHGDDHQTEEAPRSLNGTAEQPEPVKPTRKLIAPQNEQKIQERPRIDVNSLRENFLADRTSPAQPSVSSLTTNNGPTTDDPEPNGPPLNPETQRVKIVLQENPDSVPKTPILITRTMAGENLVKTP